MKELLKFITCGSVDDGKSTLIGHMLFDAKLIYADQKNALILDSKVGSRGGEVDYSLLLDGLMAEREQGITIDVAYRYFNTDKRSFIVADTPGHEEYTRNMAVGASFADLAVILIDASKGLLVQTKRHTRICALMGIRHFVFAVNKMDSIAYDETMFMSISSSITNLMHQFEYSSVSIIPVSATEGDNLTSASVNMLWYTGKSLLSYLEDVDVSTNEGVSAGILPVQRVCRPNEGFRGFQGQLAEGKLKVGDTVFVLPGNEQAKIRSLLIGDIRSERAVRGQSVTLQLDRDVDVSRGKVISAIPLTIARIFRADLLWMDDSPLIVGRDYLLKCGTSMVPAVIQKIHYGVNVNSGEHIVAKKIEKNDIINCDICIADKIVATKFDDCAALGRFILIDRVSNMTSACGVINYTLRRSNNLTWQQLDITREVRARQKSQRPMTLWFTGLSGSGKSTLANALEKVLVSMGRHTMLLDGDNVRMGLNSNLGFTEEDRVENIRRLAEIARLMNDAGLIVLVAAISPYHKDRENAKKIIGDAYKEIFVSTPLERCEERDIKGLYRKARTGEIPNFTGVSSSYEVPEAPDFKICSDGTVALNDLVYKLIDGLNL